MRHKYLCWIPALLIFASCSNNSSSDSTGQADSVASEDMMKAENTKYKLPSPVELYLLLKEAKAQFNLDALNSVDKAGNYLTSSQKAVNFGIYASDLAYCTVFEKQQETHSYFKTLKNLAAQLGVTEGYDNVIVSRIDKNLYNSDSLYQITSDSYWEVCNYLEENGKASILAPILMGGWIESVYLAINSVEKFDQNNEIVLRVTEQSYLLENLLEYLKTLRKDAETESYIKQLEDLQYSFDKLYDNPDNVLITKEQYKEISKKVKDIRTSMIK